MLYGQLEFTVQIVRSWLRGGNVTYFINHVCLFVCLFVVFPALKPIVLYFHNPVAGFSLLVFRGFLITHNDAPQSVGLLWTSH